MKSFFIRNNRTIFTIILAGIAISGIIICLVIKHIKLLFKEPDYSSLPLHYPFKSENDRTKYYAYYDARTSEITVPVETGYFETSYGRTFVKMYGPEKAPPLVLLPSGFASSLIWQVNIEELSNHFRVYAVDNIYDIGKSVNIRPVKNSDDLTLWLDELFTSIGLENDINLMGLSFGGWLSSQYAIRFQKRMKSLIMVAPVATILPIPASWPIRGILGALPPQKFFMNKLLVSWMCQDLFKRNDPYSKKMLKNWVGDALMAMNTFQFRMPVTPTVLTDSELESIKIPALFLVGEHEVIYPAQEAVNRIKSVAPMINTEIIPNASHDITISQTATVNNRIIRFIENLYQND